jgi:hypothetical protein
MTDLNVVRVESLEGEDEENGPSSLERSQSYNSWRYVDEASLYSIAEDSREDRQSMTTASRTGSLATASRTGSLPVTPQPHNDNEEVSSPVHVRWLTGEDMATEEEMNLTKEETTSRSVPAVGGGNVLVATGDEEDSLGPRHNSRRSLLFLFLLFGAALALVISLTVYMGNRDRSSPPTVVSGGVAETDVQQDNNTAPTVSPSAAPTWVQDPRQFVYDAVVSCPHTTAADLTDLSMSQMEVFETIILQVKDMTTVSEDGFVTYDSSVGVDWILERWALLNLFFSTHGELWINNSGWYTRDGDGDVCNNFNRSPEPCVTRTPGSAAVVSLDLCKYDS